MDNFPSAVLAIVVEFTAGSLYQFAGGAGGGLKSLATTCRAFARLCELASARVPHAVEGAVSKEQVAHIIKTVRNIRLSSFVRLEVSKNYKSLLNSVVHRRYYANWLRDNLDLNDEDWYFMMQEHTVHRIVCASFRCGDEPSEVRLEDFASGIADDDHDFLVAAEQVYVRSLLSALNVFNHNARLTVPFSACARSLCS